MGLEPDQILHDRYRIVRILKSGGMGSVYEAIDTKLADSPCAVKEIHEAALASNESNYVQARFYEEMKALVALDHPAIPKVRDYLSEQSKVYIVMELVQGRSLQEEIEQRCEMKLAAPVDHIALDMIRLLETLTYLHAQTPPVIHRDIKPANILRDSRSGQIKLVDFGLARAAGGPNTQTVVGTMGYCAPEQMMGKAEPRSDVYAVGVTLMHLLTGVTPEMELFEARKPDLPGLRPGLAEIIEKATQIKPTERYASAAEMSLALQHWLHRPTQSFTPTPTPTPMPAPVSVASPERAHSPLDSTKGKALAGAFVLVAMLAGYAVGHWPKSAPSQALIPSATPSIARPVLGAAAHDLKAEAKSLAHPPRPPAPSPEPVRVPVYTQASVPQYRPPSRPRPRAVVAERPVVRQAVRQVYSQAVRQHNNYSPPVYRQPVYRQPVYRQPVYQPPPPPPVQIQASGNGVQAQFNGGGFQVRAGWP